MSVEPGQFRVIATSRSGRVLRDDVHSDAFEALESAQYLYDKVGLRTKVHELKGLDWIPADDLDPGRENTIAAGPLVSPAVCSAPGR